MRTISRPIARVSDPVDLGFPCHISSQVMPWGLAQDPCVESHGSLRATGPSLFGGYSFGQRVTGWKAKRLHICRPMVFSVLSKWTQTCPSRFLPITPGPHARFSEDALPSCVCSCGSFHLELFIYISILHPSRPRHLPCPSQSLLRTPISSSTVP